MLSVPHRPKFLSLIAVTVIIILHLVQVEGGKMNRSKMSEMAPIPPTLGEKVFTLNWRPDSLLGEPFEKFMKFAERMSVQLSRELLRLCGVEMSEEELSVVEMVTSIVVKDMVLILKAMQF